MCHMHGKAFKRRLVLSVALTIMALNSFVLLLKSFVANVLNCKACLKTRFKCVCVLLLCVP